MYNEEGESVWERSLDSYGRVKEGNHGACPFMYQGQYYDAEIELAYNRFRYYDPNDGRYISVDPIGLASGEANFYSYVNNPNGWIDVFGLAGYKQKKKKEIYRYLSEEDAIRLKAGKGLKSKGKGGTIKDHVDGKKDTKYISASEGKADPTYDSGNGLVKINNPEDLSMTLHKNVVQATKGNSLAKENAIRSNEVLFTNEIPFENIEIIDLP